MLHALAGEETERPVWFVHGAPGHHQLGARGATAGAFGVHCGRTLGAMLAPQALCGGTPVSSDLPRGMAALLLAVLFAGHATAADFHPFGELPFLFGGSSTVLDEYDMTGSPQAGGEATCCSGDLQADSIADVFGLRSHSFANDDSGSGANQVFASAIATYQNVVVTGAPGPVTASLNLDLRGDMSAGTVAGGGATARVNLYVKVNDVLIVASISDALMSEAIGDDPVAVYASGVLTDWRPPEGTITTP